MMASIKLITGVSIGQSEYPRLMNPEEDSPRPSITRIYSSDGILSVLTSN